MDEATRGYIELMVDEGIKQELVPSVEWIEQEIPISSLRDLTLGYVIGTLNSLTTGAITFMTGQRISDEDKDIVKAMFKRRLPEIVEKIERELHR